MQVEITDPTGPTTVIHGSGDFDKLWAEMGRNVKFMLQTYNPERTWLNLYLSHDGKPSFIRTIVRTQE
jgi:hypothetical protein